MTRDEAFARLLEPFVWNAVIDGPETDASQIEVEKRASVARTRQKIGELRLAGFAIVPLAYEKEQRVMQKIKMIVGHEPMREREYPMSFSVGYDGVTEIEAWTENFGDHGVGWYRVKKGAALHVDLNARAVAEVHYEQELVDD